MTVDKRDTQRYLNSDDFYDTAKYTIELGQDRYSLASLDKEELGLDRLELYILGKNINIGLMKGSLDGEPIVQYINDTALEYFGYTNNEFQEAYQNKILAFVHPDDRNIVKEHTEQLIKTGEPVMFQIKAIGKNKKSLVFKGRASCVVNSNGSHVGIYAFRDIAEELEQKEAMKQSLEDKIAELESVIASERKHREALRVSEERYRIIMDQSNEIMFEWDFNTDFLTLSGRYEELFGRKALSSNVSINEEIRKRVHPDDLGVFEVIISKIFKKKITYTSEFRLQTANGNYIWIKVRATSICDENGKPIKAVGVFANIDKEHNEKSELSIRSQKDPLTKLFNREEIRRRTEQALKENPNQNSAFFIIDIDNFKTANDTYGHQFGDTVLCDMAQKLSRIFRDTDTVGRLGGDEMAVFLKSFSNDETLHSKAECVVQTLHTTYCMENGNYTTSGSVGIACYPQHGKTFDELYKYADKALYESKRAGKNRFTISGEESKTLA